jgi:Helix-turn-helix domain
MDERDGLEDVLDEIDATRPGVRERLDSFGSIFQTTTRLWQERERLGLTVEDVAERSGLTLDQVDMVEDNAVDCPYPILTRYGDAVGLKVGLSVVAA